MRVAQIPEFVARACLRCSGVSNRAIQASSLRLLKHPVLGKQALEVLHFPAKGGTVLAVVLGPSAHLKDDIGSLQGAPETAHIRSLLLAPVEVGSSGSCAPEPGRKKDGEGNSQAAESCGGCLAISEGEKSGSKQESTDRRA